MPHPHSSPSVGGNSIPRSMHLSHIILYIYIYTVKAVSPMLHHNRRTPNSGFGLRLRTQSPEYPSSLRHGGVQYSTGLHGLLRTGRDVTTVADLGRDSQKVLSRSCLGSLDSVVPRVISSGDHTITM